MADNSFPSIDFRLNGVAVNSASAATTRLSDVLRNELNCTDVKVGCNAGDCGACSTLVDGEVICACLMSLSQVQGKQVDTLSGLLQNEPCTRQLSNAFLKHGAAQCGICTPGMLVSATPLLRKQSQVSEQQVQDALGGVLCRCTGYRKIISAVRDAHNVSADVSESVTQAITCSVRIAATSATSPSINAADTISPSIDAADAIVRLDGRSKVAGTELFGDDVAPANSLVCKVVRSPYHHASFSFGEIEAFVANTPGVVRVLTAADIPGINVHGVIPQFADQPVFAEGTARFLGEAVAAVVGSADAIVSLDASALPINWQVLDAIHDVTAAQREGATQLHGNREHNIMCSGVVRKGDVDKAFDASDVVVHGTFDTGFIEHAYIEPEAGYAMREGNRISIHGCTQAPYMNRDGIAAILGLSDDAIRIVPTATGGGFGSKLDISFQPYVALAAWLLNEPVRITYTRIESIQSTTKRHPASMQVRVGADANGTVNALEFIGEFNTGAYASWGPTVSNRVPVHASGPYNVPNYHAKATAVHTHSAPSGAFRGFGVPQAAIAQECVFDQLADKLEIDRLEFRIRNALDNGIPTVTGQVFETAVGIKPCLHSLKPAWQQAQLDVVAYNERAQREKLPTRKGIGVASGWYGCGNTSLPNPSCIKAGIQQDGTICLHQGAIDIGQGSNTVITQIFAAALGVPVHSIKIIGADTAITPDAGKTSASRQTFVSGNAAKLSGLALRDEILRMSNCAADSHITQVKNGIVINAGTAEERSIDLLTLTADVEGYVLLAQESYDPPTKPLDENGQGIPYAVFGYAAHMVELDVDIELGTVKLVKLVAAHDVGKAININLIEGQIQGGIAQGIGLALMEEFIPGRTDNLHDYLIPTIGDIPPIDSIIVEVHDEHGPFGAKGLGEHVLIPTAPAILNAIRHATGAQLTAVPATPDKVLAAIQSAQNAEVG